MNILLNKFPTKIKVADEIYEINSDYRNCLKIISAYEDEELTAQEKNYIMLKRLYKNNIPSNINEAIRKGIMFLNCGEENLNNDEEKRLYSFDKDIKYVFSAVNQTHNVDLESIEYLHWWKFVFFFMDINKDCTFSYILSLRQKKNKGKLDKDEKKLWLDMREILDLDYILDDNLEDNEFMQKLKRSEADAQLMEH